MASWQEEPQSGSTVWHPTYKNGIVLDVDRQRKIVYCDFYDNGLQTLDLEDFLSTFDEGLNQFILQEI